MASLSTWVDAAITVQPQLDTFQTCVLPLVAGGSMVSAWWTRGAPCLLEGPIRMVMFVSQPDHEAAATSPLRSETDNGLIG